MTIASVGTLGTNNTKTANMSSKALTTTATAEAGNLVVMILAVDNNSTTDQDEGAVSSVTDSAGGNTWAKGREWTCSIGSAQAGSVVSLWFSRLTNQIASGGTITANFTNNTSRDACVMTAWEFTTSGSVVEIEAATGVTHTAGGATLDVSTSSRSCLRIRAQGFGDNAAGVGAHTPTSSPAFTEMVESATSGGSASSNQYLFAEFIISTGTGAVSDPTNTTGIDSAVVYVALKDVTAATSSTQAGTGDAPAVGAKTVGVRGVAEGGEERLGQVLLLHADGLDGSTTIVDSSPRAHWFTVSGNAQIDTAQAKFGGSSFLFDGTSDVLVGDSSSDFAFGTGDFTVDMWLRLNVLNTTQIFYDGRTSNSHLNNVVIAVSSSNQIDGAVGGQNIGGGTTLTSGQWYHVAVTRQADTIRTFLDGALLSTSTPGAAEYLTITTNKPVIGGHTDNNQQWLNGWLDEVRVIKGVAVWTAAFTPPTSPYGPEVVLLLHGDGDDASTTIIDSAVREQRLVRAVGGAQLDTAQSKFGGSSLLLDGTGDGVSFAPEDFAFGTGDFTIDFWVRLTTVTGTSQVIFTTAGSSYTANELSISVSDGGALFIFHGSFNDLITTSETLSINTWYHIALTRTGGNSMKLFRDGTQIGPTFTGSTSFISTSYVTIGYTDADSTHVNGWIDEFRVLKGRAEWTSNFTPPTVPYTSLEKLANCVLLLRFDGADASTVIKDDSLRQRHWPTINNNVFIDTAQSKFGGSSLFFTGAPGGGTDHLRIDGSLDFAMGLGDFTLEGWFRVESLSVNRARFIYDGRPTSGDITNFQQVGITDTTNKLFYANPSSGSLIGTTTIVAGTWYHFAATRANGTSRLFLDGVLEASGADTRTYDPVLLDGPWLGTDRANNGQNHFNGWLDDFRVIKGYAAYTATFTPPTAPYRLTLAEGISEEIIASDEGAGGAFGTGDALGIGASTAASTATAAGTGDASAIGVRIVSATTSTQAGTGDALAIGTGIFSATTSTQAGTGAASAVGTGIFSATTSTQTGTGAASAVGSSTAASLATAAGIGNAPAIGTGIFSATTSTQTGTGAASGIGASTAASIATAAGTGDAPAEGEEITGGTTDATAAASGTGDASAIGTGIFSATTSTQAGTGASPAIGTGIFSATTSTQAGTGDAPAIGASTAASVGSAAGVGDADASNEEVTNATATASGTGAASAIGSSTAASTATASGTGDALAIGTGIFSATTSTQAGTGAASAVGASTAASTATAAGVGASPAIGTGIRSATTSTQTGTGAASAVGSSTAAGIGSAAGVGNADGSNEEVVIATASASGTGAASAVGASTAASTATAAGTGAASAVGAVTLGSPASAAGVGAASAIGSSTAASTVTAVGIGDAPGIGEDADAQTEAIATASGTGEAIGIGAFTFRRTTTSSLRSNNIPGPGERRTNVATDRRTRRTGT